MSETHHDSNEEVSADRYATGIVLTAVGSGRQLDLEALPTITALLCFAQDTQKGIEAPEMAVRRLWPDASTLLVAHLIDLRRVPGMFRKIAEGVLANEQRKAVAALPSEQAHAPDDYVVMCPDWSGEVAAALGIPDPNIEMSCVVLAKDGRVVAICNGPERDDRLVEAIAGALAEGKE